MTLDRWLVFRAVIGPLRPEAQHSCEQRAQTASAGQGSRLAIAVCAEPKRSLDLPLDRRGAPLDRRQPRQIELGPAVEAEDAVLLLEHVGELGVAIAEHQRVVEQRAAQRLETRVELVERTRPVAVAPGILVLPGIRIPPRPAELAAEVRLAAIRDRNRLVVAHVGVGLAFGQRSHERGELLGILLVVVAVVDVRLGHTVRIPRRVEHRPRLIHRFRRQEEAARHIVQDGDAVRDELPRLVQRAPADDGRVRVVALQRLQPLRDVGRARLLVVAIRPEAVAAPIGELAPHQVAQPIGVIEEALLEHLLMQPRAVEAGGHAQLDVAAQRLVGRRGQDAVGVIALIEHEPLEDAVLRSA